MGFVEPLAGTVVGLDTTSFDVHQTLPQKQPKFVPSIRCGHLMRFNWRQPSGGRDPFSDQRSGAAEIYRDPNSRCRGPGLT